MKEVKFLRDQIETTFKGDSWHGPNLVKTLEGINYKQASKRPLGERHTIWEITDHTSYWMEEVWKTVREPSRKIEVDQSLNWPSMGSSEEDWQQSRKRLEAAVNMTLDSLAEWKDKDLDKMVPGKEYSYKQMLHGVVHHNLYHAGQINLLKQKTG